MGLKELFTNKEDALTTFLESPKKTFKNIFSVIRFIFSAGTLLVTLLFSTLNITIKVINNGWSASTYILTAVAGLYIIVLVMYFILLKARLNGKNDKNLKEIIYYTKYFIKVLKVFVPILLLFTLIDNPVYDLFVIVFSMFSIFFGIISFIVATYMMVHRTKKTLNKSKNKK